MSGRLIVADSFFASVEAAEEMMKNGLHFLGTVKRSSRLYPKSHLENAVLEGSNADGRYGRKMMETTTSVGGRERKMYASVWADKTRHFFIGTFTSPGIKKVSRERWRNVREDDDNDDSDSDSASAAVPPAVAHQHYRCHLVRHRWHRSTEFPVTYRPLIPFATATTKTINLLFPTRLSFLSHICYYVS